MRYGPFLRSPSHYYAKTFFLESIVFSLSIIIVPTGTPLSFMATDITSREFSLSWKTPKPLDTNGILRSYILSVSEPTSSNLFLEEVEIESVNVTNFTVSFLDPFTLYNCSIAATTIGRGPSANIQTRTAEEGELQCMEPSSE